MNLSNILDIAYDEIRSKVSNFPGRPMTIRHPNEAETEALIASFEATSQIVLNERQRAAVHLAVTAPVACITGGAGVGKTTALGAVCALADAMGASFYLLALSGRAARRIQEASGRPARTIASWIHAVDAGVIPLNTEPIVVVDESSMLDLPTTYRLLRRLQPGCRLLLLGDPGQLPPIGFGLVFHAMVRQTAIPQVELTEIMRQADATGIPRVAVDIREGRIPSLGAYHGLGSGVSFIECAGEEIVDVVMDVVNDLGGVDACRIVGAVKNGPAGVRTINQAFHALLTPGKPRLRGYAAGEPVIWLRNNADIGLLNGSLGVVVRADTELVVDWDSEGERVIDPSRLEDITLAYAITTHKAQGSQFPRVVIPVYHSKLLDRTLLYTALTRARLQVVLVGDRRAYKSAIQNPSNPSLRETSIGPHLAHQLSSLT
jgi:exodeoxyribonuclease V alpha subunit